jgi:hypothetical protein
MPTTLRGNRVSLLMVLPIAIFAGLGTAFYRGFWNTDDQNGWVAIDSGGYGVPETYVIDAEGRIAMKHVSPFNRQVLETEIMPVVRALQAEANL